MAPVLYTSSIVAFIGVPQVMTMTCTAAKNAYFGMVSTRSAELAAKGVRVKVIAPGWIFSKISRKALDNDPTRKANVMSRIQMAHGPAGRHWLGRSLSMFPRSQLFKRRHFAGGRRGRGGILVQ